VRPRLDRGRGEAPRSEPERRSPRPDGRPGACGGQVASWVRAGRVHPASLEVIAALDPAVGRLLYWSSRDLDASVELDDVVQTLALAQLEAQAAAEPSLRLGAQRRLRRWVWRVRWGRGRQRRMAWDDARMQGLAGPDGGLAAAEELVWDDVVRLLGWKDGVLVWLWTVEEWSLSELSAWRAVSKQHIWRRVRRGLARLRAALAADHGPRR
jgi:hypothetical protein